MRICEIFVGLVNLKYETKIIVILRGDKGVSRPVFQVAKKQASVVVVPP